MESKLLDLVDDFSGYGVEVCYGVPAHRTGSDFYIEGIQSLMEYCDINGIKTVLFDCRYADDLKESIDDIKRKLESTYKQNVGSYLNGVFRLEHIQESFYEPVLQDILKGVEEEYSAREVNSPESHLDEEPISAEVWAFHQGIRIYTQVSFAGTEADEECKVEYVDLANKYKNLLLARLQERRNEAYKENQRIERSHQQEILSEIASMVKKEETLSTMKTVKARSDYADRICAIWQLEKGHEWLTKKAVRAVVEQEYAYRKEL